MTTIAYRDGVLAADSMTSYGQITNGEADKIFKAGKFWIGLAGMTVLHIPLVEWITAGADMHACPQMLLDHKGDFNAFVLNNKGVLYEFDNGYLLSVHAPYAAIGSGAILALGAMAHGATAQEAVLAASRHDKSTGGPINYVHFSDLPRR